MTDTPEATLRAYIRAFETLDPEAALPFYHLPSMFIAPQGVFAAPDAGTVRALLAQFMGQLRAQSYRHTDVSDLEVRALSSELASCTGVFVRFNASGQEIARPGFTYTMRNSGGSWKIVVAAVHDPLTA
jgi:uncharacterized NTF2-like protein DUF6841